MRKLAQYMRYSGLGLQFLLSVGLPTLGGIWLDGRWGSLPWFTISGLFLGFLAGTYSLYRQIYAANSRKVTSRPESEGGAGSKAVNTQATTSSEAGMESTAPPGNKNSHDP